MITTQRVLRWAGLAALWLFLGLVLSVEVYFNTRVTNPEVSFWPVARMQFYRALFWALLAPAVLRLRAAVPLKSGGWIGGVAFHAGCSVGLMICFYGLRIFLIMVSAGEPLRDFWTVAVRNFYGRNLIDTGFYWAVIGVAYALATREKFQRESLRAARLEAQLVEAELRALKHQLNPHFLFNTMNTIAVLVREGRNDEAVQLIARLGGLLRATLDNSGAQTVSLRQELDFLASYMEIQRARFGDRLRYRTEITADALPAVVPNLILQPLVENAVVHGIGTKAEGGEVVVAAHVRAGRLEVTVRDDGTGCVPPAADRRAPGIGLANTRVRLERHYGSTFQMVLKRQKGRGTTVALVLPFSGAPSPATPLPA